MVLGIMKNRLMLWFRFAFRLGSSPDFFILGAQKAGTTSLYNYIRLSTVKFTPPLKKELYFFSEKYTKGLNFYRAHFPIFKKNDQISCEATPDYLFYHKIPERIYKFNPDVKLIVILRDPIERAVSQYNHQNYTNKTKAYDPLSFSLAIRNEEQRFNVNDDSIFSYEYKYYSYKKRGLYVEQIQRWLKYFKKEQIMFLDISDLACNDTIKKIFKFLNIDNSTISPIDIGSKYNQNTKENDILESDKEYLLNYYKGRFSSLENLTGRTFPWLKHYL